MVLPIRWEHSRLGLPPGRGVENSGFCGKIVHKQRKGKIIVVKAPELLYNEQVVKNDFLKELHEP